MATAAAAYVCEVRRKRHGADHSNFDDSYYSDQEGHQNSKKRSRLGLLSEFLWLDDFDDLQTVQDELVITEMKNLEEEICGTSKISTVRGDNEVERNTTSKDEKNTGEVREIVVSTGSYEYLVSATDDELGIPPSPPAPVDENDGPTFSQKFLSDLFEDSPVESSVTAENIDILEPCLSYCYSNNYIDYWVYGGIVSDAGPQECIASSL